MEFLFDRAVEQAQAPEDLERCVERLLSSGCRIWTEADGTRVLIETRARVDEVRGLKIYVYPKEHSPPHFHVVTSEIDASFSIETGALLRGRITKKDENLIAYWFRRHKEKVVRVWNETRPTDCPVGPVT